jgi:hypothetical protein
MTPPDKGQPKALYTEGKAKEMAVEKSVKKAPVQNSAPMSKVFQNNMQKIYGDRVRNMPTNQAFGYMTD